MIEANIRFKVKKNGNEPFSEKDLAIITEQLRLDSSFGTFGAIPDGFWRDEAEKNDFNETVSKLARVEEQKIEEVNGGFVHYKCSFKLLLCESQFPVAENGIQKLLSMFSGDLFHLSMPEYEFFSFIVDDINIDELLEMTKSEYRGNYNSTIHKLRERLKIKNLMPLLAFSIKPRIGLSLDSIERVSLGIAKEGFNIVEFDTRLLAPLDEDGFKRLLEIAEKVAAEGEKVGSVCRLSPNFSYDISTVEPYLREFINAAPKPVVIKIDFNLDGLSTIQAVRKWNDIAEQPIITCYPLLKGTFGDKFGGGKAIVDILINSGVDIIYPGGCPSFTEGGIRKLDSGRIISGQEYYQEFKPEGLAMPSVAGGVHAGELHAYYELLGPFVAYFVGGGVALHEEGPQEGAKLCKKIFEEASNYRDANLKSETKDSESKEILNLALNYKTAGWINDNALGYLHPTHVFNSFPNLKTYFEKEG